MGNMVRPVNVGKPKALFCPHTCSLWWQPAVMLWAALWRGPCGKELVSLAKSQWEPEGCQQPHEWPWKRILSLLSFVMPATPAKTLTVACERPSSNYPAKPCSDSWPTETVGDVSCFKLPNFGVICSTVVDNYYCNRFKLQLSWSQA